MIYPALTAAANFVDAVRRHNTSGSGGRGWLVFVAVAVIGLFCVGLYFWDRMRKQQNRRGGISGSLFAELCAAHQLGRSERAILTQAAQTSRVEDPALLFIDPVLFEKTLKTVATDPGQSRMLARQLFGGGTPAETPAEVTTV